MLAGVAAGVVLPRGFFGFAGLAMGRGAAPDANGGQVAVRAGVRGSAHADPHSQTQTQRPHPGVRQRRLAGFAHKFERSARAAQTSGRLPLRGLRLPPGSLVRPLLPAEGRAEWDFLSGGEGARDPAEEAIQLRLTGRNVHQLLWQL